MRSILNDLARKEKQARTVTPEFIVGELIKTLSPIQRQFILDKHRLKVARCGRRAGKSYADAVYMILTCLRRKGAKVLYLGITQSSAMDIIWDPLTAMLRQCGIVHKPLPSSRAINFANGSKIKIFGADSDNAKNRLRGVPYDLVVVDECGFVAEVDELVDIVLPSVADYGGTVALTSSPPDTLTGLFYEADAGNQREYWAQYNWNMLDNPFFQDPPENADLYKTRAEEILDQTCKRKYGGNRNHPAFVREWLGGWIRDASSLIYPYSDANLIHSEPTWDDQKTIIGLDFGVATASARAVIRYSPSRRLACVINTWKKPNVGMDEFALSLRRDMDLYAPDIIVADSGGLGAAFVQELVRKYHLPIRPADKREKESNQRFVANDLISGYLQVLVPQCQELVDEWSKLSRDKDGKEPKKAENHLADSVLYSMRYVIHFEYTKEAEITEEDKMVNQLLLDIANENEDM